MKSEQPKEASELKPAEDASRKEASIDEAAPVTGESHADEGEHGPDTSESPPEESALPASHDAMADPSPHDGGSAPQTDEATPRLEIPEDLDAEETFDQLGVPEDLLRGLASLGYAKPTAVQAAIYRKAVDNNDLLVRSKTGTGKTAAFLLPVLARIPAGTRKTQALVLAPTRELAIQVADEGAAIATYRDIAVVPIYGGVGLGQQADKLRSGAAVVVGTPGRTLDHIRRGNLDLSETAFVVLDEADEMLSMGFLEEVTAILKHVPKDHQTLLLSATVNSSVAGIISSFMRDPQEIFLSTDVRTAEGIQHLLFECSDAYPKARSLLYTLYLENPESAIIFCNTRDDCAFVSAYLRRQGFDAEFINSDLSQAERMRVMTRIKRGELSYLVATDIAARGIDISDLTHVINYSLPDDPDLYLHRVGRTGRIGKLGTAITLVSGQDLTAELALERRYHIPFEHKTLPSPEEAVELWSKKHLELLGKAADRLAYETYLPMARYMASSLPEEERNRLIAAALRVFFSWQREQSRRDAGEAETPEPRPSGERKPRGRKSGERSGPRKRSSRRDDGPRDARSRQGRGRRSAEPSRQGDSRSERRRPSKTNAPRNTERTDRRRTPESTPPPPTDVLDHLADFAAANDIDLSAWIESADGASAPAEPAAARQPTPGKKRRRGGRRRKRRRPESGQENQGNAAPSADTPKRAEDQTKEPGQ